MNEYCPRGCKYLNITEMEQRRKKDNTSHKCLKYDKFLYHFLAHPDLYKCEECYSNINFNTKEE